MKGVLITLLALNFLSASLAFGREKSFDCKVYKDGNQIAEKTGTFDKTSLEKSTFEFIVFQNEDAFILYRPMGYAGPVGRVGHVFFKDKKTGLIAFSKNSELRSSDSLVLIDRGIGWLIACEQN